MTVRGAYESVLIEIRKVKAPSLHLEDYLYWINKSIQEQCNERYNNFEINQQMSDDLGALITADEFIILNNTQGYYSSAPTIFVSYKTGKRYNSDFVQVQLPQNYWHLLGCNITNFTKFNYKCYPAGYETTNGSKKLTTNQTSGLIDNAYLRPEFNRPYHGFTSTFVGSNGPVDIILYVGDTKKAGIRSAHFDYLRKPAKISMTPADIISPVDNTTQIEFPEYVCNEIVKRAVRLILESSGDPRLQTNIPVNTSIK